MCGFAEYLLTLGYEEENIAIYGPSYVGYEIVCPRLSACREGLDT